MFGLGKHANDKVVIVSRAEWEEMQADVRGLKRLASLEEQARNEQNARFAGAIDTLDARSQEMATLAAALAGAIERNATEFSNRIDRQGVATGEVHEHLETIREALEGAFERIESSQRDHALLQNTMIETRDWITNDRLAHAGERVELHAQYGELTGRLDVQSEAIARIVAEQNAMPSIADALKNAPPPDVEKMRAYYAEKRAEKEQIAESANCSEEPVVPERAPRIVVEEADEITEISYDEATDTQTVTRTERQNAASGVSDDDRVEITKHAPGEWPTVTTTTVGALRAEAEDRAQQEPM